MPVNPKIYGHLVLFDNRFVESGRVELLSRLLILWGLKKVIFWGNRFYHPRNTIQIILNRLCKYKYYIYIIQQNKSLFEQLYELVTDDYRDVLELHRSIKTYPTIQRKTCSICSPEKLQNSSIETNWWGSLLRFSFTLIKYNLACLYVLPVIRCTSLG